MPGLEHEVHESVRKDANFRYEACQTKERKSGYWAQDGYIHDGKGGLRGSHPNWVWVTDVMSKECRYDMSLTDPGCVGCKQRGSGEVYDKMVRENGK